MRTVWCLGGLARRIAGNDTKAKLTASTLERSKIFTPAKAPLFLLPVSCGGVVVAKGLRQSSSRGLHLRGRKALQLASTVLLRNVVEQSAIKDMGNIYERYAGDNLC